MQTFDVTKPISGTTKFSQLYQIIRDHDQANQSHFSGTSAPSVPVIGQLWEDTANDKLFLYTSASGWSEVAVANIGLGLEIIAARGTHASLDARMDSQINEDGTLKASTSLNPSQWYDMTVASGYVSTSSFRVFGDNYTTVYYPTRRLKINQAGGAYYTEVYSSTYGAPDTTVVTRDAVVGANAAAFRNVSHSIVGPRRASFGDGAVSYEMIGNKNVASPTGTYTVLVGDSIVLANGTFTVNGPAAALFGAGRDLIIVNIGTGNITYDPNSTETINGSATALVLGPGQSLAIVCDGSNWKRIDTPVTTAWVRLTYFGLGYTESTNAYYMKDPFGFVHLKGKLTGGSGTGDVLSGTIPAPDQTIHFHGHTAAGGYGFWYIYNMGGGLGYLYANLDGIQIFLDGITYKAA